MHVSEIWRHTVGMVKQNHSSAEKNAARCVENLITKFLPLKEFGSVSVLNAKDVVEPFHSLLVHHSHMTVAMEDFHGHAVSLDVVKVMADEVGGEVFYTREILLTSPQFQSEKFSSLQCARASSNGQEYVVQYGIVRIAVDRLPKDVVTRIQSGGTPLGRILIEADVHREVRCVSLFEVIPGPHFSELCLGFKQGIISRTYGRFATINISSEPVIELFEVVIPPVGVQ